MKFLIPIFFITFFSAAESFANYRNSCQAKIRCKYGTASCMAAWANFGAESCGAMEDKKAIRCGSDTGSSYICCAKDGTALSIHRTNDLAKCDNMGKPVFEMRDLPIMRMKKKSN